MTDRDDEKPEINEDTQLASITTVRRMVREEFQVLLAEIDEEGLLNDLDLTGLEDEVDGDRATKAWRADMDEWRKGLEEGRRELSISDALSFALQVIEAQHEGRGFVAGVDVGPLTTSVVRVLTNRLNELAPDKDENKTA